MKFEYHYLDLTAYRNNGGARGFFIDLQNKGNDGWELCGFEYGFAWLKRAVPASPEATKK